MSEITTLQELYVDELKDLWSANDQMAKALKTIAKQATNTKLKEMLQKSQDGIAGHTEILKALIEGQDEARGRKSGNCRVCAIKQVQPEA